MSGNAAQYFVTRHGAGAAQNKPAFIDAVSGASITYGDLDAQSDKMAGLLAAHGLRREDRAAMLVLDEIEYPVMFWGALKAGVIAIPLNTLLAAPVYKTILEDCGARALFISAALLPVVEPILAEIESIEKIFVLGDAPEGMLDFRAELAAAAAAPTEEQSGWAAWVAKAQNFYFFDLFEG